MVTSNKGRGSALRCRLMSGTAIGVLFALGLAPLSAMAQSLPMGGAVTHGDAAISNSGSNLLLWMPLGLQGISELLDM